ncbi:MAG: hypothetical protein ACRDR6_11315 [Pseudonocardiaceae bacterium]
MPPRGAARGPWPGSAASRRYVPQSSVTLEVSVGVLLVCLGLLLGSTWTIQALQARFRRLAMERRRLNEEWLALRAALQRRGRCRRCGAPPSEWRNQR